MVRRALIGTLAALAGAGACASPASALFQVTDNATGQTLTVTTDAFQLDCTAPCSLTLTPGGPSGNLGSCYASQAFWIRGGSLGGPPWPHSTSFPWVYTLTDPGAYIVSFSDSRSGSAFCSGSLIQEMRVTVRSPAPPAPKVPAKLRVLRTGVEGGVLDMLVEITSRAAAPGAKLDLRYLSSGQTTTFSVPIPAATQSSLGPWARAAETSIKIREQLTASQRKKNTGIVELTYAGSSTVQPDEVRLRAASGKSQLKRTTTRIQNGRLLVAGTITTKARGVVRIRLGYDKPNATTAFLYWNAPISNGAWKLDRTLPAEAAKGGQLSIQFTGSEPRNLRGEQTAKQALP